MQEGTGTIVSIQMFQEKHAGLSTYQDQCSDAAAAAAKLPGGKLDRSSRLVSMYAAKTRHLAATLACLDDLYVNFLILYPHQDEPLAQKHCFAGTQQARKLLQS